LNFKTIKSINEYISFIANDTRDWQYDDNYGSPWFRGQSDSSLPPLPSVYRKHDGVYDEFNLTRTFRERSSTIADTPNRSEVDKWLFLMQHNGLPTRLLDWTESSLIALFFTVNTDKSCDRAIWMLHPLELNFYSIKERVLPNTWTLNNSGCLNFHAAFRTNHPVCEKGVTESTLPVAVPASYCHSRMFAQKSCFTIHGTDKRDFESIFCNHEIVENGYFVKYVIPNSEAYNIKIELMSLGITYSTVYPDLEGLAKELKERFKN